MSVSDSRRAWRNRANKVGFTVVGLNGKVRPGKVVGAGRFDRGFYGVREDARVYVADDFAPFCFPIKWQLVKAIGAGYVTEIKIQRNKHLERLLAVETES